MLKIIAACLMSMAAQVVLAQDSAIADETPTADQANDKAEVRRRGREGRAKDAEFKPPPGFLTKKRGELVVYCKKDRETGTRFVTEKCLDEAQMREYLLEPRGAEAQHRPHSIDLRDIGRVRQPLTRRQPVLARL